MKKIVAEAIDRTGEFDRAPEKKAFDSLVREIPFQLEQAGLSGLDIRDREKTDRFLKNMRDVVKWTPGLEFVGEGSSRYVYAMGDRYVLKAAKNCMGLQQNRTELAVGHAGDYECFVRILAWDERGLFIVEDRCREVPMSGWKPLIGIPLDRFVQIVRIVNDRRAERPGYSVADLLRETKAAGAGSAECYGAFRPESPMESPYRPSEHAGIVGFMENIVAAANGRSPSPLWKSLFDIFRFYFDQGKDALEIGELPWSEQWGLCGEGASKRIVLADPGVDSDFDPGR